MATRMLIDATHEEETRVVVVKGNRVEEFDFETAARRPLKGNIYLARVTRVEPSLQAAFVDFGGNRHGFLAFSEIHPDYYQIPVADRERLKQEEAEAAAEDEEDEEDEDESDRRGPRHDAESRGDDDRPASPVQDAAERFDDTSPASDGSEWDAPDDAGVERDAAADHDVGDIEPDVGKAEDGAEDDTRNDQDSPPPQGGRSLPDRTGFRRVARLFGLDSSERFSRSSEASVTGARHEPPAPVEAPATLDVFLDDTVADPISRNSAGVETANPDPSETAPDHQAGLTGLDSKDPAAELSPRSDLPENGERLDEDRRDEDLDDVVESFGGDTVDEVRRRRSKRRPLTRRYKIQEVIKRRQILLVQVVKEERGNKGAALTTYMSLAGRYCVLMPNSPNGGGISRKIVSANDRKRLKSITSELDVPEGMGMIVRTAGMERTRAEIKRDFEFLLRTWDHIRELTLASMAPCLVYEEANLIKRSIRDLYAKEIDEVLVEGENGYRTAKDLMKMLMPSHSKRVQPYRDKIPLFHRYQIETQLDEMFNPTVQLKSGGYLVINSTEALVAIDVNSGRSTKEHNIEGTAYKTNMEAAEEVARQLRLRDLAGLIVIDFIDMDESKNARNVERKLKECLKLDRARIQVGRISSFGLLEMSRQRLRPSLVEQSMVTCPHCDGQGHVRSVDSAALRAIRAAEDEGIRERSAEVTLVVPTTVAIYLLNSKRDVLEEIEGRYGIRVLVKNDDTLAPSDFGLERSKTRSDGEPAMTRVITTESVLYRNGADDIDEPDPDPEDETEEEAEEEAEAAEAVAAPQHRSAPTDYGEDGPDAQKGDGGPRRKRRRRRRRSDEGVDGEQDVDSRQAAEPDQNDPDDEDDISDGPRKEAAAVSTAADAGESEDADDDDGDDERRDSTAEGDDEQSQARRSRRRGRRGGRRRRRRSDQEEDGAEQVTAVAAEAGTPRDHADFPGEEDDEADEPESKASAAEIDEAAVEDMPTDVQPLAAAMSEPDAAPLADDSRVQSRTGLTEVVQAAAVPPETAQTDESALDESRLNEVALQPEAPAQAPAPAAQTPAAPVSASPMADRLRSPEEYVPVASKTPEPASPPRRGWWRRPEQSENPGDDNGKLDRN